MKIHYITSGKVFILALSIIVFSCKKPPEEKPIDKDSVFNIWVLNEGVWNMNNGSITGYNTGTNKQIEDLYSTVNNGQQLGDVANDIQIYGLKAYIAVNTSSHIDILDIKGVSIKRLHLTPNSMPRKIACYNGKIYVCCFDGSVVKIDTASLQVEASVKAGRNPDGICVANNKLYVSNSGGLEFETGNYDNSISVFDLNTFSEIKKITVRINPTKIKADKYNNVYVVSNGNYYDISPCLQRINSTTDELVQVFDIEATAFDIYNDYLYFYTYDYSNGNASYQILDLLQDSIINKNFISEGNLPQSPYGININPHNGDIYITNAPYTTTGEVYCFDRNGKKKFRFEAGFFPSKTVVIND